MDILSEIPKKKTVGIVGVRGYVGRELIRLLAFNKKYKVDWISSHQLRGKTLDELLNGDNQFESVELHNEHYYNQLTIEMLNEEMVASRDTDIIVLALPNGLAKSFVDKIEESVLEQGENNKSRRLIIDLSADYRFDKNWLYSVPELLKQNSKDKTVNNQLIKVSNPG
ncbi:MAG: hypothetical protein ACPGJI_06585, partial [Kangiellaceae bacterium]